MKIRFIILFVMVLSALALAPSTKITGVVTNLQLKPLANVSVSVRGTLVSTVTDSLGRYAIHAPTYARILVFTMPGYDTEEKEVTSGKPLHVRLTLSREGLFDALIQPDQTAHKTTGAFVRMAPATMLSEHSIPRLPHMNTENYNAINENGFKTASLQPVTTFSVDVDRAAYSNVRRFLNTGQMPPIDAVRIEEMINYFDYDYPQPTGAHPLEVTTEMTDSPWNPGLKLLHIGLQAKTVSTEKLPASNLVFLIDVSGSMGHANKLPLLKQAFKLLVDQLRAVDKISVVVYAGAAGEILPPTSGSEKMKIKSVLDALEAGGSTAGGAGIELAYKLAKENFIKNGNNRVILATDGDFNVGISSEGALQRLVEAKRNEGVFLSVLGFGMGNYKDSHAEILADKGNGNYAYIDNIQEARKVFVQEFGGTLFTIAKDVKFQIEFNPQQVQAYRLIGYENRALENEDFHDDKKDAGEMGSGHTVTALYEIITVGTKSQYLGKTDPLKYQKTDASANGGSNELLTLKIRYKKPDQDKSILFDIAVRNTSKVFSKCSDNLRFASSVAAFGMLLRDSQFKGDATYPNVIAHAKNALGKDEEGYRAEFLNLVKTAELLDDRKQTAQKD